MKCFFSPGAAHKILHSYKEFKKEVTNGRGKKGQFLNLKEHCIINGLTRIFPMYELLGQPKTDEGSSSRTRYVGRQHFHPLTDKRQGNALTDSLDSKKTGDTIEKSPLLKNA